MINIYLKFTSYYYLAPLFNILERVLESNYSWSNQLDIIEHIRTGLEFFEDPLEQLVFLFLSILNIMPDKETPSTSNAGPKDQPKNESSPEKKGKEIEKDNNPNPIKPKENDKEEDKGKNDNTEKGKNPKKPHKKNQDKKPEKKIFWADRVDKTWLKQEVVFDWISIDTFLKETVMLVKKGNLLAHAFRTSVYSDKKADQIFLAKQLINSVFLPQISELSRVPQERIDRLLRDDEERYQKWKANTGKMDYQREHMKVPEKGVDDIQDIHTQDDTTSVSEESYVIEREIEIIDEQTDPDITLEGPKENKEEDTEQNVTQSELLKTAMENFQHILNASKEQEIEKLDEALAILHKLAANSTDLRTREMTVRTEKEELYEEIRALRQVICHANHEISAAAQVDKPITLRKERIIQSRIEGASSELDLHESRLDLPPVELSVEEMQLGGFKKKRAPRIVKS
jgi:hypothetical protein